MNASERAKSAARTAGDALAVAETAGGEFAGALGRGVAAGLFGTAVLTLAQKAEMMITDRDPSAVPAEAVEKVLDLDPESEAAEERLAALTHWAYGAGWGAVRGLLGAAGLRGPLATLVHFGAVMGTAAVMLPRLGLAPPIKEWKPQDVAKDLFFHALYALATGAAYDRLDDAVNGHAADGRGANGRGADGRGAQRAA